MKGKGRRLLIIRLVAAIMTMVMVFSLCGEHGEFLGVNAGGVSVYADEAGPSGAPGPSGDIPAVPGAEKGSDLNPFVVLEIVPDRDLAQFGYLVGGQEPVRLGSEYGYFERVSTPAQPGEIRYDFSDVEVRFSEVEEGLGDYTYKRVTEEDFATALPDVSEEFAEAAGAVKWVEVAEGTGLFSSELYKQVAAGTEGAEYSLKHMLTEHGELEYIGGLKGVGSETGQAERTYKSDNKITVQSDGWYSQTQFDVNDYIVKFRLAVPGEDDGRVHYSPKDYYCGNGEFYVYWGSQHSEAYRNYVLVDGEGNYVLQDENDNYVLADNSGRYRTDRNGNKIQVAFNDCHFEFREVQNSRVTLIDRIYSVLLGRTLPNTSINYLVIFEQDNDGKYVVDSVEVFDFDEEIGYVHTASTYYISDIGSTRSAWGPATMTDGLYDGAYTDITGETFTRPQYVGTYTEDGKTVWLGEYTRETLAEPDVIDPRNTGKGYTSRDFGSRDLDKYVLLLKDGGDIALRFCYTMVKKTGGSYVWHGNIAADGHVITVAEAGLDAITLKSPREIDLSDPAYDRFGACATLGIWNGGIDEETGEYRNTELFKKYAIGLAYEDRDISKGLRTDMAAVAADIAAYNVIVATLTPDDLRNNTDAEAAAHKAETNIRRYVDRADLIVINSTPDTADESSLRAVWSMRDGVTGEPFRNPVLVGETGLKGTDSFTMNDLSAEAANAIFAKIGGYGEEDICPVIYDYNIYSAVEQLPDTDAAVRTVTMKSVFADGMDFAKTDRAYDINAYKLYLLSQQMNPITLYNAYSSTHSIVYPAPVLTAKLVGGREVLSYTGSPVMSSDASVYWNRYTLVPYASMTLTDWAIGQDSTLKSLGVTQDPSLSDRKSLVRNRLFSYNYTCSDGTAANAVTGFNTPMYPSEGEEKMNSFLFPEDGDVPTFYKTRDIVYYLVNSREIKTNFSKELEILEIEPSDGFRAEPYWFWYVSRFVPNYTGNYHVKHMSSSEFIGSVEDLNSTYDIVYIGGEISSDDVIKDYLDEDLTGTVAAGADLVVPVTQYIGFDFSKALVTNYRTKYRIMSETAYNALPASEKEGYERQEEIKLGFRLWENQHLGIYGDVTLTQTELGEYGVMLGLSAIKSLDTYYYAKSTAHGINELLGMAVWTAWQGIGVSASPNELLVDSESVYGSDIYEWRDSDSGSLTRGQQGERLVRGDFWLKPFYVKEVREGVSASGVEFDAGTKVYAGERITNTTNHAQTYLKTNNCYVHTGRVVTVSSGNDRLGSLNTVPTSDSVRDFAYSGDDITALKLEELYRFANAGYPVIVSRDLLDAGGTISTAMVDNSSNMYTFLTSMISDEYRNVGFVDNDTTKDDLFITALNCKSFKLDVVKTPKKYEEYQTSSEYTQLLIDDAAGLDTKERWKELYSRYYVNGADINDTTLKFTVRIDTDLADHDYEIRLYVDLNANGRYDETDERFDSLEIESVAEGIHVAYNRLKGNTTYLIRRRMDDFIGAVPWKLEVFDVSNSGVKDEVTGLSAFRVETKKRINVLQVVDDDGATIIFPTDEEIARAESRNTSHGVLTPINTSNMGTYFGGGALTTEGSARQGLRSISNITDANVVNGTGMLYYYISSMNEFDVRFYRITVADMKSLVAKTALSSERLYGDGTMILKRDTEETKIDIIVIGFADSFADITDNASRDLIRSFTEAGNTALFSHDVTSRYQRSSNPGYNMNKDFRDMFGMDRYDVLSNRGNTSTVLTATDTPWKLGKGREGTSGLVTSGGKALAQGLTNWNLDVAVKTGDSVTSAMTSTVATKVNDGQIVSYPYDMSRVAIDDEGTIAIATTHAQYYQLDMENPAMVVWYCLSGTGTTGANGAAYSLKNDVRNNYYVYNVGNIIYSGIGHNGAITEAETKLFVNMIAYSYMAGSGETTARITNADKVSSSAPIGTGAEETVTREYVYVDYDATARVSDSRAFGSCVTDDSATGHPERQYLKVSFKLDNNSSAVNKRFLVSVYPVLTVSDGGTEHEEVLRNCPLELPVYEEMTVGGDIEYPYGSNLYHRNGTGDLIGEKFTGAEVALGKTYYVKIPLYSSFYEDVLGRLSQTERRRNADLYDRLQDFAFVPSEDPTKAKDLFEICIDISMFYGRADEVAGKTMYTNTPVAADTIVTVIRRGLFWID